MLMDNPTARFSSSWFSPVRIFPRWNVKNALVGSGRSRFIPGEAARSMASERRELLPTSLVRLWTSVLCVLMSLRGNFSNKCLSTCICMSISGCYEEVTPACFSVSWVDGTSPAGRNSPDALVPLRNRWLISQRPACRNRIFSMYLHTPVSISNCVTTCNNIWKRTIRIYVNKFFTFQKHDIKLSNKHISY
jgi:hypothetical protein